MRLAVVVLAACGSGKAPVGKPIANTAPTPETLVYRVLQLRGGTALSSMTITLDQGTAKLEMTVEQAFRAEGGGFLLAPVGGGTMTGVVRREAGRTILDFTRPDPEQPHLVLSCIEKPFAVAPATAKLTDDGCGTPAWKVALEQVTLLACEQRGERDLLLAPPPGVEEIAPNRVREDCAPIDDEAPPILRHASAGRLAPWQDDQP